ncbi:MAG: hypothetical protein R3E96_14075 [Planctomycetota bacterium]
MLNCMAGFEHPSKGSIAIDGTTVTAPDPKHVLSSKRPGSSLVQRVGQRRLRPEHALRGETRAGDAVHPTRGARRRSNAPTPTNCPAA